MVRCLLLMSLFVFAGCKTTDHTHPAFDDADGWAKQFEDPTRDEWQKPDQVIAALALAPDATLADIGSATGYFPVRFAKALPNGHVFGADVESSMVDYLNKRAEKEGLGNLSSHLAEFTDPKLPEVVDVILLVNTYHHIEERTLYFKRLLTKLKPKGHLVIIDFTKESKMGPVAEAKIPADQVTGELMAAGYSLEKTETFLPEQFFLIFKPRK